MSINTNAQMVDDHELPVRDTVEGVSHQEVQCPICRAWRPDFCVTQLCPAGALFFGSEWACDGEISHWHRLMEKAADLLNSGA